jgi:hypothetical protein
MRTADDTAFDNRTGRSIPTLEEYWQANPGEWLGDDDIKRLVAESKILPPPAQFWRDRMAMSEDTSTAPETLITDRPDLAAKAGSRGRLLVNPPEEKPVVEETPGAKTPGEVESMTADQYEKWQRNRTLGTEEIEAMSGADLATRYVNKALEGMSREKFIAKRTQEYYDQYLKGFPSYATEGEKKQLWAKALAASEKIAETIFTTGTKLAEMATEERSKKAVETARARREEAVTAREESRQRYSDRRLSAAEEKTAAAERKTAQAEKRRIYEGVVKDWNALLKTNGSSDNISEESIADINTRLQNAGLEGLVEKPEGTWYGGTKKTYALPPMPTAENAPGKSAEAPVKMDQENITAIINAANEAIRKGADPEKVKERLRSRGIEVE